MALSGSRSKLALYKPTDFNSQQKKNLMKEEEKTKIQVDSNPLGLKKDNSESNNLQKKVTILKPPHQTKGSKPVEVVDSSGVNVAEKFSQMSDKDREKIQNLRKFMEKQQHLNEQNVDECQSNEEAKRNKDSKIREKPEKQTSSKSGKVPPRGKKHNDKNPKSVANGIKQSESASLQNKQSKDMQTHSNASTKPKTKSSKGDFSRPKQQHQNQKKPNHHLNSHNRGNITNQKMVIDTTGILGNPNQTPVTANKTSKSLHTHASFGQSSHQHSRQMNQKSLGPGPSPMSALKTNNPHITVPATKDKNEHQRSLDFVKNFFDNDPEVQYNRKKNAEKATTATTTAKETNVPSLSNALANTHISGNSEMGSFLNQNTQNQGNILPRVSMSMPVTSDFSNLYNINSQNPIHLGATNNTFSHGPATLHQQHRSSPGPFHPIGHGSMQQQTPRSFEMYSSTTQSLHTPQQRHPFPMRSHSSTHANVQNNYNLLNSYGNYFPHGSSHSHIFHVTQEIDQEAVSPILASSTKSGKWQQKVLTKCGPIDSNQARSLIEQLIDGTYECMVCCESVMFNSAVWNCSNCFHIFHLTCIRKWAKSEAASVKGQNGWRCPGCQNVSTRPPNKYFCFCGKVRDPDWAPRDGITPHSCGEICGKTRLNPPCEHSCNELCHPGPCPSCPVMVSKSCFCGKNVTKMRCGLLSTVRCENQCSKPLACGKHFCSLKCHDGPCDTCDVKILEECYCTNTKRLKICGSDEVVTEINEITSEEPVQKAFSCKKICDKILSCGNHRCEDECHLWECNECALLPEYVQYCPCKKVEVSVLLNGEKRVSCLDTIPTCDNFCGRKLSCGNKGASHLCMNKCHCGPCKPCEKSTEVVCRCGALKKEIKCLELLADDVLLCDRKCNKKRRCGRHKCNQKCCIEKDHNCNVICGKKLSCGQHKCEEVCHTGFCPPCWRAGFDDLTCHCGATVLYPPIPCGSKPPECDRPCSRQHACGHLPQHPCHNEDSCPPCTVLTTRNCMGGHEVWKSVPCHLTDVSCGQNCGKLLNCGKHHCKKLCHKGPCLLEGEVCLQPCMKPRLNCDHQCNSPCHIDSKCPETICKVQVTLKCKCRRKTASVICNAGNVNSAYQSFNTEILSMQLKNLQDGQTIDITGFTNPDKRPKFLECDELCSVMERNRKLADALDIDRGETDHFQVMIFSDFLKQEARLRLPFVQSIETAFENLIFAGKKSAQSVRHSFPPMNTTQRKIIHELAECYGFKTYSVDSEPKRSTVVIASKDCFMPQTKLSALIEMELKNGVPNNGSQLLPRGKTLKSILKQPSSIPAGKKVNYYDDDV